MEKKVLTPEEKKVLKSMFFRSHLVFTSFNMVKMEANGFMSPVICNIVLLTITMFVFVWLVKPTWKYFFYFCISMTQCPEK